MRHCVQQQKTVFISQMPIQCVYFVTDHCRVERRPGDM